MSYIHQEIYGQGAPVVLIHGWGMHSAVWRDFAQQLAKHYQVICVDLPGHGGSEEIQAFTLDAVTSCLLEAISAPTFSLLGWSLGATLAIAMAAKQPERTKSLTLLAGNPKFVATANWSGMQAETLHSFTQQLIADGNQTHQRFLALQVSGSANAKRILQPLKQALKEHPLPSLATLLGGLKILEQTDLRAALKTLTCPINSILGDQDTLVPVASAINLQQLRPDIPVYILKNAAHTAFLSHDLQLLTILRTCL